jgi:hypothetical protein
MPVARLRDLPVEFRGSRCFPASSYPLWQLASPRMARGNPLVYGDNLDVLRWGVEDARDLMPVAGMDPGRMPGYPAAPAAR